MEEYYQAKRRLFTGAQPPPAAVNVGDEHGRRLALELVESRRAPLITFGLTDAAEIRPEGLEMGAAGSRFRAGGIEIETPLRGRFNVENVLGVIAAGVLLDIDDDELAAGIRDMAGIPGRFEAVDEGQPFAVIVDYAHTPDSLENVLGAARRLTEARLVCVFGCGGDRDRDKRPKMGAIAARLADRCVITSDNPRSEDPEAIIADILAGIPGYSGSDGRDEIAVEPDRRAAIALALADAEPGDTVVIAGKGHEQGQEFAGGRKVPFDDRTVASDLLARMPAR